MNKYVNKPKGILRLGNNLTSSATTLDVVSGDQNNAPSVFPFKLTCEDEIIRFDSAVGVIGDIYRYNVTRGQETSYGAPSASAHAKGKFLTMYMTAEDLEEFQNTADDLTTDFEALRDDLGGNLGGWVKYTGSLSYSSPTAINSTTGSQSIFGVGDKLKYNQSIPLTAYFPLEDKDSDVGSFTVSNIGTPTYTAGKFNNALTLNGTDQALAIADDALLKPTGAFSIGMWVKTATKDRIIFQSYSDNTDAKGISIGVASSTGYIAFSVGSGVASATTIVGSIDVTDNAYHYINISSQGNHTKIFVDGVLSGSGYTPTPTYAATNYVRIGCGNNAGSNAEFYKGQIDDLFFINGYAVDEAWVKAKYNAGTAQGTSNLTVTQYNYITAVADTSLTITGGVDYVPYNGAMTYVYYSKIENPLGFPKNSKTFSPVGVRYAQITSSFSTDSDFATQITGLSITVDIPEGATIKLTFTGNNVSSLTAMRTSNLYIYDGVVGVGTILQIQSIFETTADGVKPFYLSWVGNPTAGTHTFNCALSNSTAGSTSRINAASAYPAFILAEVI